MIKKKRKSFWSLSPCQQAHFLFSVIEVLNPLNQISRSSRFKVHNAFFVSHDNVLLYDERESFYVELICDLEP